MPNGTQLERRLSSRSGWGGYVRGVLTEVGFILGLTLLALLMAVIATAVYR